MRRSALMYGVSLLVLLLCTALVWYALVREERGGVLTIVFLDVGQGDAIFIDAPSGAQVLIDGGAGSAVLRQLSRVLPWYDRSIDVIVATHPDADHIGGLVSVFERYRVARIVVSSVAGETGVAEALEAAIQEEGANRLVAKRGQVIDLGQGTRLEILFPDRDVPDLETNTGSVVARLVYGDTAFMLTGDSPRAIEEYLVRLDPGSLRSNVLKAGHHGSRTSSAPKFVGFVGPETVVFSRGCENRYGHPHEEVVALFARFEIPTLDTCEEGTITFSSDGQKIWLK